MCGEPCLNTPVPTAGIKGKKQIPGDPPSGVDAISGITASQAVDAYQVRRPWSSGTIQTGVINTFGSNPVMYGAAYFVVYPASYGSLPEKWEALYPISFNIGFAKEAIWSAYDTEPDGLSDTKLILGVGYTLAAANELFSFQVGHVSGSLDGDRLSKPYFGVSLDVLKVLDKIGR
jgi:hypothetical protein